MQRHRSARVRSGQARTCGENNRALRRSDSHQWRDERPCPACGTLLFGAMKGTSRFTRGEIGLLREIARGRGAPISHTVLYELVWGRRLHTASHLLTSHIKNIRSKLAREEHRCGSIGTVRGVGYRWITAVTDATATCAPATPHP